jgi:hypothetical protein
MLDPLFPRVPGREFSEVRQEEFIGNSSAFAMVSVGWVSTFSEQLLLYSLLELLGLSPWPTLRSHLYSP